MPLDLSTIRIVLIDTRTPENIGMSARAMKNCGLSRLALVRPAEFRTAAAYRPALEAFPILEGAEVFSELAPAVAASRMVVGTTRREGQDRHPLLTPAEWVRDLLPRAAGQEVSILFGPESDGLSHRDLDRCDALVSIPGHPEFTSFNLAQAVLLVSYEIFRASPSFRGDGERLSLAPAEAREGFYSHLEKVLLRIGFLHANNPGRILSTLRRLFGRTGLEERDVRILRGILSQIDWAMNSRVEGKSRPQPPVSAASRRRGRRPCNPPPGWDS